MAVKTHRDRYENPMYSSHNNNYQQMPLSQQLHGTTQPSLNMQHYNQHQQHQNSLASHYSQSNEKEVKE